MRSIRTVNMVWEQRFRGAYPASRYALDKDGTLALAIPRPMEARAYDITRLRLDGSAEARSGFAAETLLKLEVTEAGTDALGITADDIYLFHAGGKARFLGERRLSVIDALLSADGQHLAVAFADMAGASFAVAYGEIGGHLCWMRDVDMPVTAAAIARDGAPLAVGTENGLLWLLSASRRDLWEFTQEEPIRALACSRDGAFTAYGTQYGTVGVIDSEGSRRWATNLGSEILALALSGEGDFCVALTRGQEETGGTRLFCLTGQGQVGWEYESERRLTGLALSEDGGYLATGARDGTQTVYEVIAGEAPLGSGSGEDAPQTQAAALAEAGDLEGAVRALRAALEAQPADVLLYETFARQHAFWLETRYAEVETLYKAGDYAAACALLEGLHREDPLVANTLTLLHTVRRECGKQLLDAARTAHAAGDYEAAENALLQAIARDPHQKEARQELGALRTRRAAEAAAEAERLLAQGEIEAGVAALEQAQALAPQAERAARLERALTDQEFAAGMAHYNAKRYREAVFQFKKTLSRDPAHAEAQRYLAYAENFLQDPVNDNLTDRFRRLE